MVKRVSHSFENFSRAFKAFELRHSVTISSLAKSPISRRNKPGHLVLLSHAPQKLSPVSASQASHLNCSWFLTPTHALKSTHKALHSYSRIQFQLQLNTFRIFYGMTSTFCKTTKCNGKHSSLHIAPEKSLWLVMPQPQGRTGLRSLSIPASRCSIFRPEYANSKTEMKSSRPIRGS